MSGASEVKTGTPSALARSEAPRAPVVRDEQSTGGVQIAQLLQLAVDRGMPAAELKELLTLHERIEDRNARKEFAQALAKFKAECPAITKSKHVDIPGRSGSYGFDYAPLEEALPIMEPYLEANGFTVKWDRTADGKGMLTSVCTLRHIGGHSDSSSFTLPTESSNPGMGVQHKYAGAATFADRKAFFAVLGIVAEKEGAAAKREADPTTVSDDQLTDLEDRLAARLKGKTPEKATAWKKKFLAHFGVDSLAQIRAAQYQEAVTALAPRQEAGS